MNLFSMVDVNWTVIVTIVLFTHLAKKRFPLIKPYCSYLVLFFSGVYAILVSLWHGISILPALQDGFLHAAVASYAYSLLKKPSQSRTARNIGQKVRNFTAKTFNL